MEIVKHFKTITKHKMLVMRYCFQVGLYRQGLLHDMSKYAPSEFIMGAIYYQGNRSPNNAEREQTGQSKAWLHHKGRNKHHFEYWIDYSMKEDEVMTGMKMPLNYAIEMFLDRVSAGKNYNGDKFKQTDPLDYYNKGSKGKVFIHPDTRKLLEFLLKMYAVKGERYTLRYIKYKMVKPGDWHGYNEGPI